ncbi:MAG: transaldolase [Firmicutes bacterium HGW-Firmicutes-7]|nr:MAG: transaldolase [Firmicutes bacterium HGW-Firmicutes-7]
MENNIKFNLQSLISDKIKIMDKQEEYVKRAIQKPINFEEYQFLSSTIEYIGVTRKFMSIIDYFKVPEGETPAGFRIEYLIREQKLLFIELVRDISYDKNGIKRATKIIFSADSANPYEVEPIKGLIGNLTCNPGIVYDLFINNPEANIGNKFRTRNEVMSEIGNILGPGCDISVEVNNPFADVNQILEEAEEFKELLSEYRVVIKIPHTGPVNGENVAQLLSGGKKFSQRYNQGHTKDFLRGHNLALMLQEKGFRINFTLMFEPYQTALALQAKPYFINSFIRHRMIQGTYVKGMLDAYNATNNEEFLKNIRSYFVEKDYLAEQEDKLDLLAVKVMADEMIKYRSFNDHEGMDGLDSVRHNLRMLRNSNLPDTRLIICSMEGSRNYPELDKLLTEKEFMDMTDKIVITAEPQYLARFTSCNQVISYQRRFMNAANGGK